MGAGAIAVVGWDGVGAEEDGEEFAVGDGLHFGADDHSGELVDFLIGDAGVAVAIFLSPLVVLPDEESVHGGEGDLFVGADIAGEEEGGAGAAGVVEGGVVVGEQFADIAVARLEFAGAVETAEGVGALLVGAVDVGGVDVGGDGIHLLPHAVDHFEVGAVEGNGLGAGAGWIEPGVAGGDGDIEGFGGIEGGGFVDVVVEELAPLPEVVGGAAAVGGEVGLGADGVADGAGTGAVAAGGAADEVLVGGGDAAEEDLVDGSPSGILLVVAEAGEGAELLGEGDLNGRRGLTGGWGVLLVGAFAGAGDVGDLAGGGFLVEAVPAGADAGLGLELGGSEAADEGGAGTESQEESRCAIHLFSLVGGSGRVLRGEGLSRCGD